MAKLTEADTWSEFRRSAGELYDGFVALIEPVEDMAPHRRAEHARRRAAFVERQCVEWSDAVMGLAAPTAWVPAPGDVK